MEPPRPDQEDDKERRRQEKREAVARKLWGGEDPADGAAISQKLWNDWSENARSHAASGREIYVASINLGHTQAGYTSAQAQQAGGADAALIVQAVESAGWKLFDVGYVYQTIRERSHVLTDSAQIEGNILGLYTFRRVPNGTRGGQ